MNELLILFGLPGVGKSFVAEILRDNFGYITHNGDEDLPEPMRRSLFEKATITDQMRQEFTQHIIASIVRLSMQHTKLVLHQTLIKEFMRSRLRETFPYAKFILVESETSIREDRYMKREYFNLGLPYLRQMSQVFEPPLIEHMILTNQHNGEQDIVSQLTRLLQRS